MPTLSTTDEYLEVVRRSGVLDGKILEEYVQSLRATSSLPNQAKVLAGLFIRDGLLTSFQARQFLLGKYRGFLISGKYKLLEQLGHGGMGSVYLCEHKVMRHRVAIKVLPNDKSKDQCALERFKREARAAATLNHPNIVKAHDIDQDGPLHFLVMEYVEGASLHEIVQKFGPMTIVRACHSIRQAADGLQHAHEAGLVHRDIKAGNLLLNRAGLVKILDMGLARFFHEEADTITQKFDMDNVLGTADYVAPEQAMDSHSVDIRADIYSLGVTFYFLLTGKTPFSGGNTTQKLVWHQVRQPKSIREIRPEVPEELVAIVNRMMAKEPEERYQLPVEITEALAPWTNTPIGPPPEQEMPQLSPALLKGSSLSESTKSTPRPGTLSIPTLPRTQPGKSAVYPRKPPSSTNRPIGPQRVARSPGVAPQPKPIAAAQPPALQQPVNQSQSKPPGLAPRTEPANAAPNAQGPAKTAPSIAEVATAPLPPRLNTIFLALRRWRKWWIVGAACLAVTVGAGLLWWWIG